MNDEAKQARAAYMKEYRQTEKAKEANRRHQETYWTRKAQEMKAESKK